MTNNKIKKSITSKILLKFGMFLSLIIIATTTIAYYYTVNLMEKRTLIQLEQYVTNQGQAESEIFEQCSKNLAIMKEHFLDEMSDTKNNNINKQFDNIFKISKKRNATLKLNIFDSRINPAIYICQNLNLDEKSRLKTLAIYKTIAINGNTHQPYNIETMIITPDNIFATHSNNNTTTINEDKINFNDITDIPYVLLSPKKDNPARKVVWTRLYHSPSTDTWQIHAALPIDINNKHQATLIKLITLDTLYERSNTTNFKGAYNVIMRTDGQIYTHPKYMDEIKKHNGPLMTQNTKINNLKEIFRTITETKVDGYNNIYYNNTTDEYIAVTTIEKSDCYFISIMPKNIIRAKALPLIIFIFSLGLTTLIIELYFLKIILIKLVSDPLAKYDSIAKNISDGIYANQINIFNNDEIGRIGNSLNNLINLIDASQTKHIEYENQSTIADDKKNIELGITQDNLLNTTRELGIASTTTNTLSIVGNLIDSANKSICEIVKSIRMSELDLLEKITEKLKSNKSNYNKYVINEDEYTKLINVLDHINTHINNKNVDLVSEIARVSFTLEKIQFTVTEQQEITTAQQSLTLTTLTMLCNNIEETCKTDHAEKIKISNTAENQKYFYVDTFKTRAILCQIFEHLTTLKIKEQILNVTLEAELNTKNKQLKIVIKHLQAGCQLGEEEDLFIDHTSHNNNSNLHYTKIIASELNGTLTAKSLGQDMGMVYTLTLPYYEVKNQNIAA